MKRILQLGAVAWVVSEVMEIYSGHYTDYNSSVSAVAFSLIAIGILSLFRHQTLTIVGKIGTIGISAAMFGFTWIAYGVIGSGVMNDLEISQTPLFMVSGALIVLGSFAIAFWLTKQQSNNLFIGIALLAITFFSIIVSFIPELVFLQPYSNMILATILFWLASLKTTHKTESK